MSPLPDDEEFGKKRRGTNDCLCECGCWCIGVFEQQIIGGGDSVFRALRKMSIRGRVGINGP